MLIFNKGELWVVGWSRRSVINSNCYTSTDIPAIVKQDNIIFVSDNSVSDILHHISHRNTPGYTPILPIFEIYSDGSILQKRKAGTHEKPYLHTYAFDAAGLTVVGSGARAFIGSLSLSKGDVVAAIRNTIMVTPHIKYGARITRYVLPSPNIEMVEPESDFILD